MIHVVYVVYEYARNDVVPLLFYYFSSNDIILIHNQSYKQCKI